MTSRTLTRLALAVNNARGATSSPSLFDSIARCGPVRRSIIMASRPSFRWMRQEEEMRQLEEERLREKMEKENERGSPEPEATAPQRPALITAGGCPEVEHRTESTDHGSERIITEQDQTQDEDKPSK